LRPGSQRALDPDPAAMHLDDLSRYGQTQPGADDSALGVAFVSLITAEQAVDELGRNARSMVPDAYLDVAALEGAADLDLATRGRVFDGVAQKVRDHLEDPIGVADDDRYSTAERDGDAVLGARHAGPSRCIAQQRVDVDRPHVELH